MKVGIHHTAVVLQSHVLHFQSIPRNSTSYNMNSYLQKYSLPLNHFCTVSSDKASKLPTLKFPTSEFIVLYSTHNPLASWSFESHGIVIYSGINVQVGHILLSISSPNIDRFSIFFTGTFCGKFVINYLLSIPPHCRVYAYLLNI